MPRTLRKRFHPEHAATVAIVCSDGRYIRALEEFLLTENIDEHDLLALPGGPGCLCRDTATYSEAAVNEAAFEFLARAHHSKLVVLVAHADCGFYRSHFGRADRERQERDLRAVARVIGDRFRDVTTRGYFIGPSADGAFVIDGVALT